MGMAMKKYHSGAAVIGPLLFPLMRHLNGFGTATSSHGGCGHCRRDRCKVMG